MTKRSGKGLVVALGVAGIIAGGGVYAFKYIFNRPGESAIGMLPADSIVMVTLDTNPSERQMLTFNSIRDTLNEQGFGQNFDSISARLLSDSKLAAKVRPYLTNNLAFSLWGKNSKLDHGVLLVSVNEPKRVEAILKENKAPEGMATRVIESYLVIGKTAADCDRIAAVRSGEIASAAKHPQYLEARKALPADANLMLFVSYDNLEKQTKGLNRELAGFDPKATGYMAMSATIEDKGIAFDSYGDTSPRNPKVRALLSQFKAMDLGTFTGLPSRAYGALGFSGADIWVRSLQLNLSDEKDTANAWTNGVESFEKSTGLSVEEDLIPVLSGTISAGVYPGKTGKPEDIDLVMEVQNDDPSHLRDVASKLRAKLEDTARKEGKPAEWSEKEIDGNTWWSLRAFDEEREGSPLKDKVLVYVETENGLIIGSSPSVINRALKSAKGLDNLGSDPGYAAAMTKSVKDTNGAIVVHLNRIMEALRPSITKSMRGGDVDVEDLLSLFGGEGDAMIATGTMENGISKGKMFLPIDWRAASRLLGKGMKSMNKSMPSGSNHDALLGMESGEAELN